MYSRALESWSIRQILMKRHYPAGRPGGGLEPPGARVEGVRGDTLPVGGAGGTGKSPAIADDPDDGRYATLIAFCA